MKKDAIHLIQLVTRKSYEIPEEHTADTNNLHRTLCGTACFVTFQNLPFPSVSYQQLVLFHVYRWLLPISLSIDFHYVWPIQFHKLFFCFTTSQMSYVQYFTIANLLLNIDEQVYNFTFKNPWSKIVLLFLHTIGLWHSLATKKGSRNSRWHVLGNQQWWQTRYIILCGPLTCMQPLIVY